MPSDPESETDFVYRRRPSSEISMPERPVIPQFPEEADNREILRSLHTMMSNVHMDVHDTKCEVVVVKHGQRDVDSMAKQHNKLVKSVMKMRFQVGLLWAASGVILFMVAGTVWKVLGG